MKEGELLLRCRIADQALSRGDLAHAAFYSASSCCLTFT